MHKVALFNGKFEGDAAASIPAWSSAALYGRGVFTTIAVFDRHPFLFDKHVQRLTRNAGAIGLDLSAVDLGASEQQTSELINANSVVNGRVRITLFDASGSGMWGGGDDGSIDIFIVTADQRRVPDHLKVTISPYPINSSSPLTGIKSCNYLENLLALAEAKDRRFDEAIRLNEHGEVASASMANIFWLKGEQLLTPSVETGCLGGTTREYVLESFDCREVRSTVEDLLSADAVFLTSAGVGIKQVSSIDDREFENSDHSILSLIPPADKKTRMSAK